MVKRRALITGGSRGIGKAIVDLLEDKGIFVLAPSRKEMNLLSDSAIDKYLSSLKKPIDIIINNAGINLLSAGYELEEDNIRESLQVNLLAPLRIIRKIIPDMMHQKYGRIVNISSIWSVITKPRRLTYTMTKSGLNGMTKSLAIELAPYNILVNCIAPGYVNTELTRKNNSSEEIENIKNTIPLKRLSEPVEIAEIVSFLVSEKNSYITGQVIIADGGYTCL